LPKIQKVVSKFNIPGYEHSDILQEALYALRYKAIKDYDKARGTGEGPAPFDKFALLCIRRHLATEFKSSYQNKKRVLNQSVSIYKESYKSSDSEENVSLSNILSDPDALDICELTGENEYYKNLQDLLLSSLSSFEKEVYILYAQKYSYEEIAEKINNKRSKIRVNIKGVDNALSRIKHKAKEILEKYEE
jgi:RNA polymerase sigma factor (sigma-70 family)